MMDVSGPTMVLIAQYVTQAVMPYAWNLHRDVCQLFLSKTRKNIEFIVT